MLWLRFTCLLATMKDTRSSNPISPYRFFNSHGNVFYEGGYTDCYSPLVDRISVNNAIIQQNSVKLLYEFAQWVLHGFLKFTQLNTFSFPSYATRYVEAPLMFLPLSCRTCCLIPICGRKGSLFRRACRPMRKRRVSCTASHSFSRHQNTALNFTR